MDWAEEKAWKWDGSAEGGFNPDVQSRVHSLTALLREVDKVAACRIITNAEWDKVKRDTLLAEVRRVVEDVQKSIWGEPTDTGSAVTLCCHEILSRLEKL